MPARFFALFLMGALLFAQGKVPLATFSGTVHGVSNKRLTLENGEGNLLEFEIDRKTKTMRNKKEIRITDLATGDIVTIEARQVMSRFLIAVNIIAQAKQ